MIGIVTLLYSIEYLSGAFALGYQLEKILNHVTDFETCLLITENLLDEIAEDNLRVLHKLYHKFFVINGIDHKLHDLHKDNLSLLNRPELKNTLIKLQLWNLTEYEKILYLDSDILLLFQEIFKIFEIVKSLSINEIAAVPDCGWPDMFNSGVMLIIPDIETYNNLTKFALEETSIDGADQGILNQYFNPNCHEGKIATNWVRLPFIYNVTVPNSGYQAPPALTYFQKRIQIVHFIGKEKPWITRGKNERFRNQWWSIYNEFLNVYFLNKDTHNLTLSDNTHQIEDEEITISKELSNARIVETPNLSNGIEEAPGQSPESDVNKSNSPAKYNLGKAKLGITNTKISENRSLNGGSISPIFPWEQHQNEYTPERHFPE